MLSNWYLSLEFLSQKQVLKQGFVRGCFTKERHWRSQNEGQEGSWAMSYRSGRSPPPAPEASEFHLSQGTIVQSSMWGKDHTDYQNFWFQRLSLDLFRSRVATWKHCVSFLEATYCMAQMGPEIRVGHLQADCQAKGFTIRDFLRERKQNDAN